MGLPLGLLGSALGAVSMTMAVFLFGPGGWALLASSMLLLDAAAKSPKSILPEHRREASTAATA